VRFAVMNFWAVVLQTRIFQPTTTLLIKLVEALIHAEPEPDKESLKKVKYIYEHTHKKVDERLSYVEFVVFRNIGKGAGYEIEIGEKTFTLLELYGVLDEVTKELSNLVIFIAKKYSLDIPNMMNINQSQKVEI
jgi:hypothetical protein